MLVRSTRMCAASVITARLPAICPPVWNTCLYHGSGQTFESIRSNLRPALLWIKGNTQFSVIIHMTQKSSKIVSFYTSFMQWKLWTNRKKGAKFLCLRKCDKGQQELWYISAVVILRLNWFIVIILVSNFFMKSSIRDHMSSILPLSLHRSLILSCMYKNAGTWLMGFISYSLYACSSWVLESWKPDCLFVTGNTKTVIKGNVPVEELW